MVPDLGPLVEHTHHHVLLEHQGARGKFEHQRPMVHAVGEPVAKFAMHGKERGEDHANRTILQESRYAWFKGICSGLATSGNDERAEQGGLR